LRIRRRRLSGAPGCSPMEPTISVAMCTHNAESTLRDALESWRAQEFAPTEIVVCDDASSDRTVKILREFAQGASFPVRIYENGSNIGESGNFSSAISRCSGDIIALSDADDFHHPSYLARVLPVYADDRVGMVFTNLELADERLKPLGKYANHL